MVFVKVHPCIKNGIKLSNSFEISKNIISKFSGRPLICQIDSLDVVLLDDFFLRFEKWSKLPDPYFWVLIWLIDINCNAQSKLFTDFSNLSLPALGVESLKPRCCCSMKSFCKYYLCKSKAKWKDIVEWARKEMCSFKVFNSSVRRVTFVLVQKQKGIRLHLVNSLGFFNFVKQERLHTKK